MAGDILRGAAIVWCGALGVLIGLTSLKPLIDGDFVYGGFHVVLACALLGIGLYAARPLWRRDWWRGR